MAQHTWTDPAIHTNYHTLRQSIMTKANLPGAVSHDQADKVDRYWRRIGKLAQAGRL